MLGLVIIKWTGGVITTDAGENIDELFWKSNLFSALLAAFLLIVIALSQIMIIQKRNLAIANKLNERCIDEQITQYQLLQQKDEELRAFKHDYKAHMTIVNSFLHNEDIKSAIRYVEQIGEIEDQFHVISTNNLIVDAILNQYKELGKSEGIDIHVIGSLPKIMKLKESDLCGLFSNAMSNAFEATVKCVGKRNIEVEFLNNGDYLFINIKNPTSLKMEIVRGVPITTKDISHGIGTKNMIKIAEKNKGKVIWENIGNTVITRIRVQYK
ncbi:MAG: GHKL domain-containing protein [Eubacteriaceae bacterium]|nr:GHKL domain-containing protein [Eubacteriaceae bacterium]